ncbi:anti-sigma B factor antagonist [Desulfitispora alkaliphila]|uniref:STAS domain-containing protein n=1 Tax=Desulfitispora alkaliphila TaxID=622674 RepID=UPI003D1B651D
MKITRKNNNEATITPDGKIDISNSHELKQNLLTLYDEGVSNITIDFTNVISIDSSGLGKLLLFQKKLKERNGELRVVNITSDYVKKMFTMIHLDKVIKIES